MKSILLSIKPKWLEKILSGEKTIEIRKTMPKCDLPVEVYLYCTKGEKNKELVYCSDGSFTHEYVTCCLPADDISLNGRVVAKFTLREVKKVKCVESYYYGELFNVRYDIDAFEAVKIGTDSDPELFLFDYGKGKDLYAWHISDLVVFDEPMELGELRHISKGHKKLNGKWSYVNCILTHPPASWQYVEVTV